MFDNSVMRHIREFARRFRNHEYEQTPTGILFPKAKALFCGVYTHGELGGPMATDRNRVVTQCLTDMLSVYLNGGTQHANFYLALFGGAATPAANWTAASFASTAGEITSGSEGYSESTRQLWVPGTASAGSINNDASKAQFTIVTASQLTITGAGMLTNSAKGSTSGVLINSVRFAAADVQNNGSTYTLGWSVTVSDPD